MEQSAVSPAGRPFRCLVADDSQFARRNISRIISSVGGEVVAEAVNGEEAVDLYARTQPDLVLLDITMPVLDGIDTLKRIIASDQNAKVIIVSSVGHKDMIWNAICLGARHFVTKPFSPEYAGMIIKSVVGQRTEAA